jgi:hypothetical protein
MFTEALHSLVDTVDQGLLLYGMHRAKRPPDEAHPFGYGLELYFWSFVVALLIFSLGGAFAIYEGVEKIRHPERIRDAWVNFTVLGLAVVFEGYSFGVAWREMRRRHADVGMWSALRRSKDPSTFTVILEDGAALIGLGLAAAGVTVSVWLDEPRADGVASFAIGVLLVGVAVVLAHETRSLPGDEVRLVGEWRASGERKFYLSNLPPRTTRRVLVGTIKARWVCEQVHQQCKEELGLDHFEGRSWTGLHRHALMTCIACAYLQHLRLARPERAGRGEIRWPAYQDRRRLRACPPCVRPSSADCSWRLSRPCDARTVGAASDCHLISKCPGSARVCEIYEINQN